MGPRGCISYTPTLVLRQLGQFQVAPKKNSMGGYNHLYQNEDTYEIEDKIKKAWKNVKIQKTKGLTNQGTTHSPEYKTWRDNRIKGISVSTNLLSKFCCGQSREACSLASELEVAKAQIHQKEEIIQELNLEARKERESREILEQEVENLSALLARRENECLKGWESSNRYCSMMIDATEYGHFWRREAVEERKDVEKLKRKYAHASESISNFIPCFVNQFEKAKEQVDMAHFSGMPDEVVAFMNSCKNVVKRFQKKKMRLLTR
ncbi:hypothetical protein PIB30_045006 [Stylosanthes scabra]|uniref:DUF7745 domain-containing protein n=1 Tax=Stylosanthes scabra TaxID=79078 RepID=A0ABU6YIF1_9FABA|nr:hypothetical protein [Stylosanthes scabra]